MRKLIIAVMLFAAVCMANQMQRDMLLFARLASRQTSVPWTPADLDGLALWLDAADAGTLWADTNATTAATNNGAVARWDDKSGFTGRHFLQDTSARRPLFVSSVTNGLSSVKFDGNDMSMVSAFTNSIVTQTSAKSAHVVGILLNAATGAKGLYMTLWDARGVGESGGITGELAYRTNTRTWISETPASVNQVAMVGLFQSAGTDLHATTSMRLNGASVTRTSGTNGNRVNFSAGMSLGQANPANTVASLDGYLSEVVITSNEPSTADRQKLEGYLAHKWGLTANLPADHPWKENAPTK